MTPISNVTKPSVLMDKILVVRFSDLDELRDSCEQLLQISQANQDVYGVAFAYLYLLDYALSVGNYKLGRYYLMQAQNLCQENNYRDLLLTFHNIAGLFYQDLFDEQSALQHYLNGLQLAQELHDPITESKIYNNIGICFRRRHDNQVALQYFQAAYATMEPHIVDSVKGTMVSFLCNLAEVYQIAQQFDDSYHVLKQAEAQGVESKYWDFHIGYTWCGHYAMMGDKATSMKYAQKLIDDGLSDFEHFSFKVGALVEVCRSMLMIDCQPLALRYLELLEACCDYENLGEYYNCIELKLEYYERYGSKQEQAEVYREFYMLSMKMNEVDNTIKVNNVLSMMELSEAQYKRKILRSENERLRQASHIDELTKLYNRRYLTKLQTKVLLGMDQPRLGYIILDIDYFKEYNDFYGHHKGDEAICTVAQILKDMKVEGAHACRYGGDEFLVMCVDWTNEAMHDYVLAIQKRMEETKFAHEKSLVSKYLTLSLGYSNGVVDSEFAIRDLLEEADKALYEAKDAGRNQCRSKMT